MDTRIRTDTGPRDWTPGGGPPRMTPVNPRERMPRAPTNWWRGIGLLTLLLGAGAVIMALATIKGTEANEALRLGIGPVTMVLGIVAVINFWRLSALDRVTAVIGLALATVGTVVVVVSLLGLLNDVATEPPAETAATSAASESLTLAQAAGTASYLLAGNLETYGIYPSNVIVAADTLVTPGGNVQLPAGTRVSYLAAPDSSAYTLTLIGSNGGFAQFDSLRGTVLTTPLQ